MSTDNKSIEGFAKLFHHYHATLAPDFGCGMARDTEWSDLPSSEQKRIIAAVRLALTEVESTQPSGESSEPRISIGRGNGATEGREWGC
jgi:hypothetical protein